MIHLQKRELLSDLTPDKLPSYLFKLPHFVLLESSLRGRYSIAACDPCMFISADADFFSILQKEMESIVIDADEQWPFTGGWIGFLGYESYFLTQPKVPKRMPDLINAAGLGFYDSFYIYDHQESKAWCAWLSPRISKAGKTPGIAERLLNSHSEVINQEKISASGLTSTFTRNEYEMNVRRIQQYILDGDCYQVNLSQRFQAQTEASAFKIFNRLRQVSPAPYSTFFNLGDAQILSASPESFLEVNGKAVVTRPIKGTRRRGKNIQEDELLKKELQNSEKDRAELLMITDLERNDFGRVCEPGSISVSALQEVETFPQVHHLVSTIRGKLAGQYNAVDLLQSVFPGGSITGAPKIRAMQIIRELEPHARDIYCGTIGFLSLNGKSQWNIAIRTMILKNKKAYFYGGGGIVADSKPEDEYEETLSKSRGFFEVLELDTIIR